jgi:hypothetical protein
MLDRASDSEPFQPKYIGLATRNGRGALHVDSDNRVGMTIHDWNTVKIFPTAPDHLRLFVAKGTHSLYLDPGQKNLDPLNPADPSSANCGASEKLAGAVTELAGSFSPSWPAIMLAKAAGGMAALG